MSTSINIPPVNLVPRSIRRARVAAWHLRAWGVAAGVCVVLCALATGVLITRHTSEVARQDAARHTLAAQRAQLEAQCAQSAQTLAALGRRLAISDIVRVHPDWSTLLRLLAARRAEGITFERLEIVPKAQPNTPSAAVSPPERFTLRLQGVADSQPTFWFFIGSLESTHVFESVKPVNTGAREIGDRRFIDFSIECALSPTNSKASARVTPAGGEP